MRSRRTTRVGRACARRDGRVARDPAAIPCASRSTRCAVRVERARRSTRARRIDAHSRDRYDGRRDRVRRARSGTRAQRAGHLGRAARARRPVRGEAVPDRRAHRAPPRPREPRPARHRRRRESPRCGELRARGTCREHRERRTQLLHVPRWSHRGLGQRARLPLHERDEQFDAQFALGQRRDRDDGRPARIRARRVRGRRVPARTRTTILRGRWQRLPRARAARLGLPRGAQFERRDALELRPRSRSPPHRRALACESS